MGEKEKGHYERVGDVDEWVWDDDRPPGLAMHTEEAPAQAGGYAVPPDVEPEAEVEDEGGDGGEAESLEDYTVAELKDMARDQGIVGFSTMNKAELVEALEEDAESEEA